MFSAGGGYELVGSIGQPDAGVFSGGGYELTGGFWAGAMIQYQARMPLLMKQR